MRSQARTRRSGLRQHHRQHRQFFLLEVQLQSESLSQEPLHHQSVLVLRRVQRGCRLNIKTICLYTLRQIRQYGSLLLSREPDLPRKLNVGRQREIRVEPPIRLPEPLIGTQRKRRRLERTLVLVNSSHLERHRASGCLLPGGNALHSKQHQQATGNRKTPKQQRQTREKQTGQL